MNEFDIESSELLTSIKELKSHGGVFQYYEDAEIDGRKITINGRELIHFANCSYLGLEKHPLLIKEAREALEKYGTQSSISRAMLSSPLYKTLEENLSKMFPGYQAVFATTTLAHCSALPLLIGENDAIILDANVHNSVRMASQLCKANGTFTIIARHNDMEHIKYLIYRLKKDGYRKIWYCADGLYSIHGDFCDLPALEKLLNSEDNFYAYIDDAHSTGWCGKNGSGYIAGQGKLHEKIIVVESFAKSMAANGAAIVSTSKEIIEILGFTGQTMIFSGPIQPATLGALNASVKIHLSEEVVTLQRELLELINYFIQRSTDLSLPVFAFHKTPIQLLKIGSMEKMFRVLMNVIQAGFLPMTAGYPAVAKGEEGLRMNITRHLKKADINSFLECVKQNIA
jgi:7-keto-8-aminopelargonate synthetase-like enzyme